MPSDLTRSTFDPENHYSSVRHQAGRLILDADLNEQRDIGLHDIRQARIDIIGRTGVPQDNPGLEIIANGTDLEIGAGVFYLDGIRVHWPAAVAFGEQAHAPVLSENLGLYLAVLHVWERPIDAIDDPHIREVALGGPDTATRTQVVAQVELLPVDPVGANPSCATVFPEWARLLAGSTVQLEVRLAEGTSDDPCSIPEDAGYRGLENQLYVIQAHDGNFDPQQANAQDPTSDPTFKWSRDSGAVVASWTAHDATVVLTIDRLGPGGTQGFAPGEWIEVTDEVLDLQQQPGLLASIASVGPDTLTLSDPDNTLAAALAGAFNPDAHPRVRRWDSTGARALAVEPGELGTGNVTADGWHRIESGIEIRFNSGAVRNGDHWLLPARTAALPGTQDRQLDWPVDPGTGQYALRSPDGHAHHYARLAVAQRTSTGWAVLDDCRPEFPPLTDLPDPTITDGCGEIGIEPGGDLQQTLLQLGVAAIGANGALVPAGSSSLALCFRPGEHAVGNLFFSGWTSLGLSGTGAAAVTLRGRLRVRNCEFVTCRDLGFVDVDADGNRIAAADDEANVLYRWRTRVVEIQEARDVTLERLHVDYLDPRWRLKDGQAVHVSTARDVRICDCVIRVPRGQNGIRVQNIDRTFITGNRLLQDWGLPIDTTTLSPPEQNELSSWIGRLLLDLDNVRHSTGPLVFFTGVSSKAGYDRRAFRVGFGPGTGQHWTGRAKVLGLLRPPGTRPDFLASNDLVANLPGGRGLRRNELRNELRSDRRNRRSRLSRISRGGGTTGGTTGPGAGPGDLRLVPDSTGDVRDELSSGAETLMGLLYTTLNLLQLLPGGTSSSPGDLRSVRFTLQHALQTRRAQLGAQLLAGSTDLPDRLRVLGTRLVGPGGWQVGLGGTGIRVAIVNEQAFLRGAIHISGNWVENFAVGIEATWRQDGVAMTDIQRIDICDNSLRLHSPLLPVQRGGIIAGGARRIRVEGNDIDVLEGSSYALSRSRGWFVGVDGIRLRGRHGAWVAARNNHIRGCAVGIRDVGTTAVDALDPAPAVVSVKADNAFVGCDTEVIG